MARCGRVLVSYARHGGLSRLRSKIDLGATLTHYKDGTFRGRPALCMGCVIRLSPPVANCNQCSFVLYRPLTGASP